MLGGSVEDLSSGEGRGSTKADHSKGPAHQKSALQAESAQFGATPDRIVINVQPMLEQPAKGGRGRRRAL